MNPLISVIIPVYKSEQYLSQCIESVRNQTYKNLEIILVDDGSPDRCPEICDEYQKKDRRIKAIHKQNGGVSSARNSGLELASGGFIGFVDSDDWVEPNMYEDLVNLARLYTTKLAVCSFIPENGKPKKMDREIICCTFNSKEALYKIFLPNGLEGFLCNKLFCHDLFEDAKLRLNEKISFCEDLLCVCQAVLQINNIAYTNKRLYHYRIHRNDLTSSFSNKSLSALSAYGEILYLLNGADPSLTKLVKGCYSNTASSLLCKLYLSGNTNKKTVKYLKEQSGKYIYEFYSSPFSIKDKIRMTGTLYCAPIFCRLWNRVKLLSITYKSKEL